MRPEYSVQVTPPYDLKDEDGEEVQTETWYRGNNFRAALKEYTREKRRLKSSRMAGWEVFLYSGGYPLRSYPKLFGTHAQ
jgi:hypothetical protein